MTCTVEGAGGPRGFYVRMNVTEFPEESVKVTADGGWLVITATNTSGQWAKLEYRLPLGLDASHIKQSITSGILTVEGKLPTMTTKSVEPQPSEATDF